MDREKYLAKPNKTIKEHVEDLLRALDELRRLGYIRDERIYLLAKEACKYHDDGKANPEFSKRIPYGGRFNKEKEVAHNVLSFLLMNPSSFQTREDYYVVAHAVLNHHNYGNALQIIDDEKKKIDLLLEEFEIFEPKAKTKNKIAAIANNKDGIWVKGLLHKCDYSASGQYKVEYKNDFLEVSLENLRLSWRKENENADWNELQKFCVKNKDKNLIAVAQTGMGKTEAGLLWIGDTKGYFVLPLRTAINAIYDRVRRKIIGKESIEDVEEKVAILHSESLEYYSNNIKSETGEEDEDVKVYEYYQRGRRMSIPLNISTMDQLFDFVFKHHGYELKLTTFAYSKIVIDEIQMYSPDLLAYLLYGIKRIVEMGGQVAIVTATLSPFIRDELLKIFPRNKLAIATFIDDTIRHSVQVLNRDINAEDILNKYKENLTNGRGNKILVVCNTIKRAQEIYLEVKKLKKNDDICSDASIKLLHARFTKEDRAAKEEEILKFGSTFNNKGQVDIQNGIWISTSLVEASLDIDFDYLFTELSDINSLFQRMGRCNRKGKKEIKKTNCFVYTMSRGKIDTVIFDLSKEAIKSVEGQLSEQQKIDIIEEYFTTEKLKKSDFVKEYKKDYEFIELLEPGKFEPKEGRLRSILTETIIPSPVYEKLKDEIDSNVNLLKEKGLSPFKRGKVKEQILKYSVSVPSWDYQNYIKRRKDKAISFPILELGKNENIRVMECDYDIEFGYQKLDYERIVRAPEFV